MTMRLPVMAKDAIKEALMDHLGGAEPVGAAAFAVQLAVARTLLESGAGLILEGAFFRDQHELSELVKLGRTAVVDCIRHRWTALWTVTSPGKAFATLVIAVSKRSPISEHGYSQERTSRQTLDCRYCEFITQTASSRRRRTSWPGLSTHCQIPAVHDPGSAYQRRGDRKAAPVH